MGVDTGRIHPTLSSVAIADAPPGMFARILRHEPTGARYYEPPVTRSNARSEWRVIKPKPATPSAPKPRWSDERIAALPLTSGTLTRVGIVEHVGHTAGAVHVVLTCSCGLPECRKRREVPAHVWARDSRPQSCKAGARARRKATHGSAFTDRGAAHARAFAERQKRRQDEPEAAE